MGNGFRITRPAQASGLGVELIHFSFKTGASNDTIRDAAGNLVASVTKTAAGKYTVQFQKPYPKQLVAIEAFCRQPAGSLNRAHVNCPSDTGDALSSGQILLEIIVDDGTPAIEEPAAGSRVSVIATMRTFNVTILEA